MFREMLTNCDIEIDMHCWLNLHPLPLVNKTQFFAPWKTISYVHLFGKEQQLLGGIKKRVLNHTHCDIKASCYRNTLREAWECSHTVLPPQSSAKKDDRRHYSNAETETTLFYLWITVVHPNLQSPLHCPQKTVCSILVQALKSHTYT